MTDAPPIEPPPRIIAGRYALGRRLGAGSMGEVWAARHVITDQEVAVKLLFRSASQDERTVERFLREVRLASAIEHPGVARVYDAGRDTGGNLYIAMELLEGQAFGAWLRAENPPLREALLVVARMLEALRASHAAGVVHRDVKPDNIFVLAGPPGARPVKLLDFGIARSVQGANSATQTGFTVGTPHYMSPEQAVDPRNCGPSSDVWAVGVLLYELTTGHPPFRGETATAVCMAAVQQPHRPLQFEAPMIPIELAALVDECLRKAPGDRPTDAGAVLDALQPIIDSLAETPDLPVARPSVSPAPSSPPTPAETAPNASTSPTGRSGIGLIALAVLCAAAGTLWLLSRSTPEPGPPDATVNPVAVVAARDAGPAPDAAAPVVDAPVVDAPVVDAPVVDAAPSGLDALPLDAALAPPDATPATEPPKPRSATRRRPKSRARPALAPRAPPPVPARAVVTTEAAPPTAKASEIAAPPPAAPATVAPATAAPATVAPAIAAPGSRPTPAPAEPPAPAAPKSSKSQPVFFTF